MLRRLFDFKGTSPWLLASSAGLNLVWATMMLLATNMVSSADAAQVPDWWGLAMILAAFLGPLMIGFVCGRMARDQRGPTYGVAGSLGGAVLLGIFVMLSANLQIGFITAAVALMGGFNGGVLSQRR